MLDIGKVYEEYFEAINRYLFCLTHNKDLAEELTQETFYKAVTKINTFKEDYEISAWLCGIAKNLYIDRYRKEKRVTKFEEKFIQPNNFDMIEDEIILKDEKLKLYDGIQSLDTKAKKVVYLRIVGELSFKEIGFIMNESENWARIVFYRAKNKLKVILDKKNYGI